MNSMRPQRLRCDLCIDGRARGRTHVMNTIRMHEQYMTDAYDVMQKYLISHMMRSLMQPTEAQIEEQLEWERHAKAQGLSRLHQQTCKLEKQDYASASVYGIASIDCIMPRVIAEIERTTYHIHKGQAMVLTSKRFKSI